MRWTTVAECYLLNQYVETAYLYLKVIEGHEGMGSMDDSPPSAFGSQIGFRHTCRRDRRRPGDQDGSAFGSLRRNTAPLPCAFSAVSSPPWARARSRAMARPRPVPPLSR